MLAMTLFATLASAAEPASVVFVAEPVPAGGVVLREHVYVARMDPAYRPENTLADVAEVVGRVAAAPLLPGAPIRAERLVDPGAPVGLAGLLRDGEQLVRLPVVDPASRLRPGDHVDAFWLGVERACVSAEGVRVLAGETIDGAVWTDPGSTVGFTSLHLAAPKLVAGLLASQPPSETHYVVRAPEDRGSVPASVARCSTPRLPIVAHREDRTTRRNGRGARVVELLRGENAFVGELRLPGGARIPPHRDPTEEYLVVIEGQGIVTIDGTSYSIETGSVVYMPARAKVSYVNGAAPLLAFQVFAGPSSAAKYLDWIDVSNPAPDSVADSP